MHAQKGHPVPTQHICIGTQGTKDGMEGSLLEILTTQVTRASLGASRGAGTDRTWQGMAWGWWTQVETRKYGIADLKGIFGSKKDVSVGMSS